MLLLWPCLLLLITLRSINVNLRLLKAKVEFLWWVVVGWGLQTHFHVQPKFCVEVVLCCVVVGVVTTGVQSARPKQGPKVNMLVQSHKSHQGLNLAPK